MAAPSSSLSWKHWLRGIALLILFLASQAALAIAVIHLMLWPVRVRSSERVAEMTCGIGKVRLQIQAARAEVERFAMEASGFNIVDGRS